MWYMEATRLVNSPLQMKGRRYDGTTSRSHIDYIFSIADLFKPRSDAFILLKISCLLIKRNTGLTSYLEHGVLVYDGSLEIKNIIFYVTPVIVSKNLTPYQKFSRNMFSVLFSKLLNNRLVVLSDKWVEF